MPFALSIVIHLNFPMHGIITIMVHTKRLSKKKLRKHLVSKAIMNLACKLNYQNEIFATAFQNSVPYVE